MKAIVSRLRFTTIIFALTLALPMMLVGTFTPAASAAGRAYVRHIARSGTTSMTPTSRGADALRKPEIARLPAAQQGDGAVSPSGTRGGPAANSAAMANSNSELVRSFNGLTLRDQRLANGGNQFTVEPPDQGLCVGNGFVMESVNDVLNVYSPSGKSLLGVTDLNTFYGYPAQINRTTGVQGPFVTDPSCYFDVTTSRWFQIALTLDTFPNGAFTGTNHLDIAVSKTSDPTGSWNIYRLPVQDDGTQGTPNHHCAPGPAQSPPPTNPNACFGDYPHLGADANGFYVTTNEYPFFALTGFHAAQVYAFSKFDLASGSASVTVVQYDTVGLVKGNPGFTLAPATSPDRHYASAEGGTEYFMSTDAAQEANGNGVSSDLIVWALTGTSSLNTGVGVPSLSNTLLTVNPYGTAPPSEQKAGPFPLGQCLNDPTCATTVLGGPDPFKEVEGPLDSGDTRMLQVTYVNGRLWGALDTILTVGGVNKAGIEWFVVSPSVSSSGVSGKLVNQGYLGRANTNLIYPAIGITSSGSGVMAFTLVGKYNYPSAAYALIDANGVGSIHIAAAGLGPQDGFTEYQAFGPPFRPRWGDYGAAVPVGNSVWIASEYIGQTCTLAQYEATPFGSCGGTRVPLGNWYTRISQVEVEG